MSRDDEDRRPDGDGSPVGGEPFSPDDIVIPDDLSELDADVRALHRERRAAARRAGLRRLVLAGRWRRFGATGPIVVGVLLVLAGVASLMLMFPARRPLARPVPLATGVRAAGEEGGLVPDVVVHRADGDVMPLRDYRPAVVAVLPASCNCDPLVRNMAEAAFRHHLLLVLAGRDLPALPSELADGVAVRVTEPTGRLAGAYQIRDTPVLLLVRADGVVNRILTEEPTSGALDGELSVLMATGSGGSG